MIFFDMPMSYSSNHQYTPVRGRLIKSSHARNYTKSMDLYYLNNINLINIAHETFNEKLIKLSVYFVFPLSKIYTKQDTIRKFDIANLVKSFQDEFCRIIRIDDSIIKSTYLELISCETKKEHIVAEISTHNEVRTYDQAIHERLDTLKKETGFDAKKKI